MHPTLPAAFLALSLAACVAPPPPDTTTPLNPDAQVHSFTIDRAYSLTDSRELAFRDQIAAAAREVCEMGEFTLYSSRPIGVEEVREDSLYRQHEVQITCDR